MPVFPQLSFARTLEEEYLFNCDGSCTSGDDCACLSHGVANAGKRLPLLDVCVLCARRSTTRHYEYLLDCGNAQEGQRVLINPYCNQEGDYDVRFYLDNLDRTIFRAVGGPFIAYDPQHYQKVNDCGIKQTFRLIERNWLSRIFTFTYTYRLASPKNPQWFAYFCMNPRCKLDLLNFVDQVSAEGSPNIIYDVSQDVLLCLKCKHKATKVFSTCFKNNVHLILKHRGKSFSRCSFCNTMVHFDKYRFPQSCKECHETHVKLSLDRSKICYICSIPVNGGRRGGCQSFDISNKKYFLCKHHRIRASHSISTLSDLKSSLQEEE